MTETAVVKSVDKNFAIVEIKRSTACGESCANCSVGCNKSKTTVVAKNIINAVPGDRVKIYTNTSLVLKSAFIVYILPLVLFFIGYAVTKYFNGTEVQGIIVGVIMFVATFVKLHFWDKKRVNNINTEIIDIMGEN